jgi:hypothetical protein
MVGVVVDGVGVVIGSGGQRWLDRWSEVDEVVVKVVFSVVFGGGQTGGQQWSEWWLINVSGGQRWWLVVEVKGG